MKWKKDQLGGRNVVGQATVLASFAQKVYLKRFCVLLFYYFSLLFVLHGVLK